MTVVLTDKQNDALENALVSQSPNDQSWGGESQKDNNNKVEERKDVELDFNPCNEDVLKLMRLSFGQKKGKI